MVYPLPRNEKTGRPHVQAEAFCLMKYKSRVSDAFELVWNSRDGVTPFGIRLRNGEEAEHVEWQRDQYLPNYVPAVGDRVFVDMTPEAALTIAKKNVALYRKQLAERPENELTPIPIPPPEEIAFHMLAEFWPHAPMLVEVTEELQKSFIPPSANVVSDALSKRIGNGRFA